MGGDSASDTAPANTTAPTSPAPADSAIIGASQYPCSDEGTIHSVPGGAEVPFSFTNNSSESVQIIWLNFAGARVPYVTLSPGGTYNASTYIGDLWLIADPSASCLGIFLINESGQISVS